MKPNKHPKFSEYVQASNQAAGLRREVTFLNRRISYLESGIFNFVIERHRVTGCPLDILIEDQHVKDRFGDIDYLRREEAVLRKRLKKTERQASTLKEEIYG